MKYLIFVLLSIICSITYSKEKKVLKLDDHYSPNHITFGFDFGGGQGFTPIYTGFDVDDGSIATFFPGGGILFELSTSFMHGERWTYGLSYSYQLGGLNLIYENGDGANARNIIAPSIKLAPVIFDKGKINLGIGLNMVLSNYLKVAVKLPNENQSAKYSFKKSVGPVFYLEYQENTNDWLGGRIGLRYSHMNYELFSYEFNNIELNSNFAPIDMKNHSASSLHLYLGIYVYW